MAAAWVFADSTDNLSGYAWSENTGWISFNSTNAGPFTGYGVNVAANGTLSGNAWSEHIGWISFDAADLSGCPSGTCTATFNKITGQSGTVTGWAKALAGVSGSGFDGWISLSGTNYGVTVAGCDWDGYAWGSDVIGWIHFKGTGYGVVGTGDACTSGGGAPPEQQPPGQQPPGSPPGQQGQVGAENTQALCSDTIDNDGDTLIDLADSDCAAFIPTQGQITASLGAAPSSGFAPQFVTLTSQVSGESGTINYSFWWDCSNTTTDVAAASAACGALPASAPGTCVTNSVGAKCDGISAELQSTTHTYPSAGSYKAKVIAERGSAAPKQDQATITLTNPPTDFSISCTATGCPIDVVVATQPVDSSHVTIQATPINGFSNPVTLSVYSVTPALPTGTTYHFSQSTLTCDGSNCGSSEFWLTVPADATLGQHTITIKGSGNGQTGTLSRFVDVKLNVKEIRPEFREI